MNNKALILLSLLLLIACENANKSKNLIVCGDNKIIVIDIQSQLNKENNINVIWEWQPEDSKSLPELYKKTYFTQIDECKSIKGANKILVASSHGGAGIIERESKDMSFYTYVGNAHSIELVSDSLVAVVGSFHEKGNRLSLFRSNEIDAKPIYTDSIYGGHGLVWENKNQILYVLGFEDLRVYKLLLNNQLKLLNNWKIPGKSGHDLIQDPMDSNKLILTESENVWEFDKLNNTFSEFQPLVNKKNVKSVSISFDEKLAYTQAEESWWTHHINVLNPQRIISVPNIKIYKCRWDKR